MASALEASTLLTNGSCRSSASAAEQLGSGSSTGSVDDLREELGDGAQPLALPSVDIVERLTKDELTAARIVAEVEPVADAAPEPGPGLKGTMHRVARGESVDAADHQIDCAGAGAGKRRTLRLKVRRDGFPVQTDSGSRTAGIGPFME